jgi:hypothetical protein
MTDYFYVVEGLGQFPIEMLRYDRALPASEQDAYIAMNPLGRPPGRRRVVLVSHLPPTVARWESFTWKVDGLTTKRHEAERARGPVEGGLENAARLPAAGPRSK